MPRAASIGIDQQACMIANVKAVLIPNSGVDCDGQGCEEQAPAPTHAHGILSRVQRCWRLQPPTEFRLGPRTQVRQTPICCSFAVISFDQAVNAWCTSSQLLSVFSRTAVVPPRRSTA